MKKIAYFLFSVLIVLAASCKEDEVIYNTAGKAGFVVDDYIEVGVPVSFTDKTVPENGTEIVSYLWEFGDEEQSTSSEQNPTFTYKKDGLFTVTLTITDSNELKAASKKEITVINPTKPDFTLDKEDYQMGDEVKFMDATTTKEGTTIQSYLWEFGDSEKTTSTEQNPSFIYTEAGAFAVKLTVTDNFGLKASVTKNVTVFDPSKAIAVLWSTSMTGSVTGGSSPALSSDGSIVYVLTGGSDTESGQLKAYNIANGSQKWALDIDKAMCDNHDGGSLKAGAKDIYGSPSVDNQGNVYFVVRDLKDAGADRRLFVFSIKEDGNVNWAYPGKDANVYSITPAIDAEGNVFVAQRAGKIWKLSATGAQTEYTTGLADFTSGISLAKDGSVFAMGKGNLGLLAYNWASQSDKFIYNTDFGGASDAMTGALKTSAVTVGADGTIYSVTDLTSGDGAVYALAPNGTEKWSYKTAGSIPDGGVVLGSDGTIFASGGVVAGANSAGIVALNADGTLKWHYSTAESVQTSPIIDDRGYIHFVTALATYYVVKPDGSLFSSMSLGEKVASTPVMDERGNLLIPVIKDGTLQLVCASSKATSYAKDSAWPMKGQNPQRTGLQK